MQSDSKIFDDFAKLASGALGTAQGMKAEMDNLMHQQMERMLSKMDLVPRDEFDAVKAMVVSLSDKVEQQEEVIKELKAQLAKKAPAKRSASSTSKKKS
ncbi:accessory factor UbiK family protein [Sneathiella limimaris]|uniref:accessory factor UbiK family protein n=1 Tax=Sneathiella limimaris TaxID=1964213 RepID=UPI0019D2907E|nr:accessory factor UbiK family protein [Sneathiella limimaris]